MDQAMTNLTNIKTIENESEPVLQNNYLVKNYTDLNNNPKSTEMDNIAKGESNKSKAKFPKRVFLIIINEFCERFSYYGLRTILIIYFTQFIHISDNNATALFHAFTMICYFTPIFGAIIADCYIGMFKTILSISIIYAIGEVVLCLTSIKPLGAPNLAGPIIGLLLIGFGTGGIKPCVSAFGGNQFINEQKKYLDTFFSIFYLSINIGAFIGSIITPILRSDVKCFNDNCYPIAFGVPAILMFISIVVFVCGRPLYHTTEINRNEENLIKKLFFCILHAIKMRFFSKNKTPKHTHWLDYAQDKYENQFISDVKAFCKVIFMFLPVPVFWALFDQQGILFLKYAHFVVYVIMCFFLKIGSRWTLQAQKLNTQLSADFSLKADQIQSINSVLVLLLVPVFNWIVYPLFKKCNLLTRPLQRMVIGMLLAVIAFIVSAGLEYKVQSEFLNRNLHNPSNNDKLINLTPFTLDLNLIKNSDMPANITENVQLQPHMVYFIKNEFDNSSSVLLNNNNMKFKYNLLKLNDNYMKNNYLFYQDLNNNDNVKLINLMSSIRNEPIGNSQFRIYYLNKNDNELMTNLMAHVENLAGTYKIVVDVGNLLKTKNMTKVEFINEDSNYQKIDFGTYNLNVFDKATNSSIFEKINLENGARYTFILYHDSQTNSLMLIKLVDIQQNSVNFAFQFIQYFIITCAEIMFSINGLSFAYSQAPQSMKSILQAAWLLTVAFGNLIVVIIAEANLIKNQVYEYLLFAALMFITAIVFAIMSYFYKYTDEPNEQSVSSSEWPSSDKIAKTQKANRKESYSSDVQLIRMSRLDNAN